MGPSNSSRTRSSHPPLLPTKRTGKEKGRKTNPPRYRPHTRALNEIRQLKKPSKIETSIPKELFTKMVREVTISVAGCDEHRYQAKALTALLVASEHFIIGLLQDSYLITLHRKRVTLLTKDLKLAYKIRGDVDR